jgi:two-component system KDP operon response regulator KdpE
MKLHKILVIEDEVEVGTLLAEALQGAGYVVEKAFNATAGLAALKGGSFDCVLLDLGLPDLDGLEVIRQVRRSSATPIIIVSARGLESQKVEALDLGADDYLVKPVGLKELFARLRALERRAAISEDRQIDLGLAVVDLDGRRIRRGGSELPLTPTEFALLEVLVEASGRLVTHRKLLATVWGGESTEQTHYLRIYMSKLRQKLEPIPAEPRMLFTETGVGYRLVRHSSDGEAT